MYRKVKMLLKVFNLYCIYEQISEDSEGNTTIKKFYLAIKRRRGTITKTWLCSFDPLKPHFYIVKMGCTEVNIIFLISAQKIVVLVRTASSSTHNLYFEQKYKKISEIFD